MIKQQDLYDKKQNCCGCEQCSSVCAHGVLAMMPDAEGFLYPSIVNANNCVDCKRCINVCPIKSSTVPPSHLLKGFGGHALDEIDIKNSSSGGFSTILGRYFINNGGVVYGVRYSEDYHSARYSRAASTEDLELFRTSKYFQAIKGDIFKQVKRDLISSLNVLFVGLPCEIAALHKFLSHRYDNLYVVSLICHGVTSPKAHDEFCSDLEKSAGSAIKSFSVRYKLKGFKPYYIKATYSNDREYLKPFVFTDYEMAFKYLKRPSCSHCKFKLLNKDFGIQADLIIGDFHGQKPSDSFYNKWGSSVFYACSLKGETLLSKLEGFEYSEINISGKEWSSPVLSAPTKTLLFHNLFSSYFTKYGLKKASNAPSIKFAYKFIQPKIKKGHSYLQRVQVRLFHKVYIW